jgi:flavin reductase (DIM6/NTAB) family NADH-FMN oxidoreductase RutF
MERTDLRHVDVEHVPPEPVDPRKLRACLGQFATGVTVITYESNGEARGATVNSFTSVSMDPALVLVSIAKAARTAAGLSAAPFTVNVLAASQIELALHFAGKPQQGLDIPWNQSARVPRLKDCVAWIECAPWREIEAGDHVLFLGRVVEHDHRGSESLLFHDGQFRVPGRPLDRLSKAALTSVQLSVA